LFTKVKRLSAVFMAMLLLTTVLNGFALADPPEKLQRGDKGAAVEELQKLLKKHNCYNYAEITGYYGNATEEGVRKFQAQQGLTVDGIAGADTQDKLKNTSNNDSGKQLNPDSLARGMSGDKVKEIQQKLKKLGLYNEPEITGFYGPKTEAAVTQFQKSAGMKADGIAGKKTREALMASFSSASLVPGMKNDDVLKLQKRLAALGYFKGQQSGLYGQITQDAVESFQKYNGLDVDGIAGKATRAAINNKNARTATQAKRNPVTKDKPKPKPKYVDVPGQSAKGQETGQAIVEYAKKFLGVPYRYGADGPNSFDCTGLTCYVYNHFGVSLPRSAKNQGYADYGIKITDTSKLMPGDLLFFNHSNGIIGHAAIYVGSGMMIHSPYTGTVVKITKLGRSFAFGRRVFK
jgi:peptidoglycan DL-endopeptidase LytE